MNEALRGCRVVITRERPGALGRLLGSRGASVAHVPLIEAVDGDLEGLRAAWSEDPDWAIVTSSGGAERIGVEAAARPDVRLAAVGTATARTLSDLAGRMVDLVPERQLAQALVDDFVSTVPSPARVLVAQADRAAPTLVEGLRHAGHAVAAVAAYRTLLRRPERSEIEMIERSDAVVFASGSAARSWADAMGADARAALPRLVVAIGPSTAAEAERAGLTVTHVAAVHSLDGVIDVLTAAWESS